MSQPTSPLTPSTRFDDVPFSVLPLDVTVTAPALWSARPYDLSPVRLAELHAPSERVEMARQEMATVLHYWAYRPELWRIVGFTAPPDTRPYATAPIAHPIVEVVQARMVVRRQQMGLTENDVAVRHAFMAYLTARGIPVPSLVAREPVAGDGAEGATWAAVPIVPLSDPQQAAGNQLVIEQAIYEIQTYVAGRRFVTDGPDEEADLAVAAQALAALHQASSAYAGLGRVAHPWPHERTMGALAEVYLARIAEAGRAGDARLARPVAAGLRRLAREATQWVRAAQQRLDAQQDLPWLLAHGDYQPHNLAFAPTADTADRVVAIYDFDAMHRERRVVELAYALLAFAGLRWDEEVAAAAVTAVPATNHPLVAQGLDLDRAAAFLAAYGGAAPPQPGEAESLGDALMLVLPIVFANGVAPDLVFAAEAERVTSLPRVSGTYITWATSFPEWVEVHRDTLRDAWQGAGVR